MYCFHCLQLLYNDVDQAGGKEARPGGGGWGSVGKMKTHLPLPVCIVVDVDGSHAGEEKRSSKRPAQGDGVARQVEGRRGVDGCDPVQAAPAQVVACPVMHDVHGPPISCLPPAIQVDQHCLNEQDQLLA